MINEVILWNCIYFYCVLSASIGFNFAALYAGNIPNTTPIVSDIKNAAKVQESEYTGVIKLIEPIPYFIVISPRIIPIIPPIQ